MKEPAAAVAGGAGASPLLKAVVEKAAAQEEEKKEGEEEQTSLSTSTDELDILKRRYSIAPLGSCLSELGSPCRSVAHS